eukprot:CAMPEP_0194285642 /NCGR_PEP_ID=MMETSP0169-20130528/30673_1 /TAXON_ID=218684 /ORGANISM="Corethron pennatum, Strain L29A3" /LENGTH=35 /DNA_ID= /DNA_START= /DNA_END= /DNA_ORIENTATION=
MTAKKGENDTEAYSSSSLGDGGLGEKGACIRDGIL